MMNGVQNQVDYLVGVDGGGTGTRVVVATPDGCELARGQAGPSALRYGAVAAWDAVMMGLVMAFSAMEIPMPPLARMAIGLGLAGVHHAEWATQFAEKNPGFGCFKLDTDARTTLLGAHQGRAGGIVAIGTGSVGEAVLEDGSRREVGGWGFPCGDEAGGAWLGLRAMNHLQQVLDGRRPSSGFAMELMRVCCGESSAVASVNASHQAIFSWLAKADQASYAQLAPIVVEWGPRDSSACQMLVQAGIEIASMVVALDPAETIPIALCGGLAEALYGYIPEPVRQRIVAPVADSASGALVLIHQFSQCSQSTREAYD